MSKLLKLSSNRINCRGTQPNLRVKSVLKSLLVIGLKIIAPCFLISCLQTSSEQNKNEISQYNSQNIFPTHYSTFLTVNRRTIETSSILKSLNDNEKIKSVKIYNHQGNLTSIYQIAELKNIKQITLTLGSHVDSLKVEYYGDRNLLFKKIIQLGSNQ